MENVTIVYVVSQKPERGHQSVLLPDRSERLGWAYRLVMAIFHPRVYGNRLQRQERRTRRAYRKMISRAVRDYYTSADRAEQADEEYIFCSPMKLLVDAGWRLRKLKSSSLVIESN